MRRERPLASPSLETERLRLRPFRASDLDAYAALCADPEVMRFLGGETLDRAGAWRHMAMMVGHWTLRGFGMWAVETRDEGTLAGRVGFNHHEGWPGFEIAWTLARPCWGRGYATEAGRAALEHAFTVLGRDHVISLIHPDNAASARVAGRLGLMPEGAQAHAGTTVTRWGIRRPARARTP